VKQKSSQKGDSRLFKRYTIFMGLQIRVLMIGLGSAKPPMTYQEDGKKFGGEPR
jgi:hypothetical protein